MATFRKRPGPGGKNAWQAQIIRRGHDRQYKTFNTKAEAEAWAAIVESEMARGVFVSRAEAETTTLAEALERYEREVMPRKKATTANRERDRVRSWAASSLARRPLASIRGKDVAGTIRDMEGRGLSPNTIRLHLALLSHLFNTARTAWGMESLSNPVEMVRGQRPKLPQGRDRRLQGDEQARLLTAAATYGGEIGPLITWAIETAMRRGEIAAMRWEHVDRKARVLLIPETKNGISRRIPLSRPALAVLDGLSQATVGPVWTMQPASISQALMRLCKASGITGLTFHDLRHEAASRLSEKGFEVMEVAAITGHKTMQMVKRYTHYRAEDFVGRLD